MRGAKWLVALLLIVGGTSRAEARTVRAEVQFKAEHDAVGTASRIASSSETLIEAHRWSNQIPVWTFDAVTRRAHLEADVDVELDAWAMLRLASKASETCRDCEVRLRDPGGIPDGSNEPLVLLDGRPSRAAALIKARLASLEADAEASWTAIEVTVPRGAARVIREQLGGSLGPVLQAAKLHDENSAEQRRKVLELREGATEKIKLQAPEAVLANLLQLAADHGGLGEVLTIGAALDDTASRRAQARETFREGPSKLAKLERDPPGDAEPAKAADDDASDEPAAAEPTEVRELSGAVGVITLAADSVNPGTKEYIVYAIERAERMGLQALVIELDTPGGLVSSTREIVKAIMGAAIPVAVYVAPAGARAGSAGVFITYSGHIAAMAEGTNIGAAHPVMMGGGGDDKSENAKHLQRKIENDTIAFIKSIAEKRERNVDWAVLSVRDSVSITANRAYELGVIDLVANSTWELLKKMDGRVVEVRGEPVKLRTKGAEITKLEMTFSQQVVNIFSHPQIALYLFMFGVAGIMFELYHPGVIVPGVIGGICLILALISVQALPINIGGLLLVLLGVALLVAEAFVPSFGIMGIGGAIAFVLGTITFYDGDVGVEWWEVAPVSVALAGISLYLSISVFRSRARPEIMAADGLVGQVGTVRKRVTAQGGSVNVLGEIWRARAESGALEQGTPIEVVAMDGLTLLVRSPGPDVAAVEPPPEAAPPAAP